MFKKFVSLIIVFVLLALPTSAALAGKPTDTGNNGKPPDISERGKSAEVGHKGVPNQSSNKGTTLNSTTTTGFDQYGYNDTARIFNGTGLSWCMGKLGYDEAGCRAYMGDYANDKLVMKWNAEWDHGNTDGWTDSYYNAWENNQWNGKVPGGSGEVWHYKIVWVGPCNEGTYFENGGYCIWGQFEVIMDQGSIDGVHSFLAHGNPSGYGAYKSKPSE